MHVCTCVHLIKTKGEALGKARDLKYVTFSMAGSTFDLLPQKHLERCQIENDLKV